MLLQPAQQKVGFVLLIIKRVKAEEPVKAAKCTVARITNADVEYADRDICSEKEGKIPVTFRPKRRA